MNQTRIIGSEAQPRTRACRHRCGLSALVDFDGHVRVDQPVRVAAPARWAAVCSSVLHLQQQAEQLARALRQLVLGRPAPAPLPPPERPHQAACQQPHWPVNSDSAALACQLGFSRTRQSTRIQPHWPVNSDSAALTSRLGLCRTRQSTPVAPGAPPGPPPPPPPPPPWPAPQPTSPPAAGAGRQVNGGDCSSRRCAAPTAPQSVPAACDGGSDCISRGFEAPAAASQPSQIRPLSHTHTTEERGQIRPEPELSRPPSFGISLIRVLLV